MRTNYTYVCGTCSEIRHSDRPVSPNDRPTCFACWLKLPATDRVETPTPVLTIEGEWPDAAGTHVESGLIADLPANPRGIIPSEYDDEFDPPSKSGLVIAGRSMLVMSVLGIAVYAGFIWWAVT